MVYIGYRFNKNSDILKLIIIVKVPTLLLLFGMDSENLINHFQKIITLFSLGEQ